MRFKTWLEYNDDDDEIKIQGEYWIDSSGSTHYCDSDIGDIGHEGYIIDMVAHEIANEVGFDDNGEYIDSEKLLDFLADEEHSIPLEKLKVISGRADARVYGMKVYGWKAVRGNAVDTWTGTPKDLKIIAEGLLDILYNEGKIDDVNKVDDVVFDIWIHSLGFSKEYTIGTLKNGGMEPFAVQQPLLSSQPNKIGINQYNFGANNIAKNQIDDQEKANMNPYYQQKKFPFADWRI